MTHTIVKTLNHPTIKSNFDLLFSIFFAVVAFLWIFGLRAIDPHNINLMVAGGDLTQSYLGSAIYLSEPWSANIFRIHSINPPNGVSILAVGSIPIVSVLFKLLTFLGYDPSWQFYGLWSFLCFVLSAVVSTYIFRLIFPAPREKYLVTLSSAFGLAPKK